jgi:hypothetical protein
MRNTGTSGGRSQWGIKGGRILLKLGPPKDQSRRRLPTGGKSYKGKVRNWSFYGQIVEDVKGVLCTLIVWEVCHTKREANCAPHSLAKAAVKQYMDWVWVDRIHEEYP